MIPKYSISYSPGFSRHAEPSHYSSDDPVAFEEFVGELLERGFHIRSIKHEGVELPRAEFDRMIKTATGLMAARHICASLHIDAEEERYRFGFAA